MKTQSFVKLLRKVIREEVGRAVKQALNEQKTNHSQVIEHGLNLHELSESPKTYKKQPKKMFSKNDMLNDILDTEHY